jgi:hypothetical protein
VTENKEISPYLANVAAKHGHIEIYNYLVKNTYQNLSKHHCQGLVAKFPDKYREFIHKYPRVTISTLVKIGNYDKFMDAVSISVKNGMRFGPSDLYVAIELGHVDIAKHLHYLVLAEMFKTPKKKNTEQLWHNGKDMLQWAIIHKRHKLIEYFVEYDKNTDDKSIYEAIKAKLSEKLIIKLIDVQYKKYKKWRTNCNLPKFITKNMINFIFFVINCLMLQNTSLERSHIQKRL